MKVLNIQVMIIVLGTQLVTQATAFAAPGYLEIEAKEQLRVGMGYSPQQQKVFPQNCIRYKKELQKRHSEFNESGFEWLKTSSQLVDKFGLSVAASVSVNAALFSGSVKNKTDILNETKISNSHLSLLAYKKRHLKPRFINENTIKLSKHAKSLLKKGKSAFKNECGEFFVVGVMKGREYFGVVSIEKYNQDEISKLNSQTDVNARYALVKADIGVDVAKSIDNSLSSEQIKIKVISDSHTKGATRVSQVLKQYRNFGKKGSASNLKFFIAPYSILKDYNRAQNSINDNQAQLMPMNDAYWDLKSLIDEANFVLQNNNLYALGDDKDRWIKILQYRKETWKKEKRNLSNLLAKCTKELYTKLSTSCRKAAKYWDRRLVFAESEYYFPDQRAAICEKTDISGLIKTALKDQFHKPFSFLDGGDRAFGNGPVEAVADFKLKRENDNEISYALDLEVHERNSTDHCKRKVGKNKSKCKNLRRTSYRQSYTGDINIRELTGCLVEQSKTKPGASARANWNSFGFPMYASKLIDNPSPQRTMGFIKQEVRGRGTIAVNGAGLLSKLKCSFKSESDQSGGSCEDIYLKNIVVNLESPQHDDIKRSSRKMLAQWQKDKSDKPWHPNQANRAKTNKGALASKLKKRRANSTKRRANRFAKTSKTTSTTSASASQIKEALKKKNKKRNRKKSGN